MGLRLPIIYVRGFGGGQSGIDKAVDDPFYGFNEGSTHIRVGAKGEPKFHQFEGPLMRLMNEDSYKLRVGGNQQDALLRAEDDSIDPECVWIYRFYDSAAGTFGREPQPYRIEDSAHGLVDFIDLVRRKTRKNPPVYLVAHSMGGLICRSALQRVLFDQKPEERVSKLITIGTPHGSIDPTVGGDIGDWFIRTFGPKGSDIFEEARMREYLLPDSYDISRAPQRKEGGWDSRVMVGYDPGRVLCIVGTNARDYDVAYGASALAMGEQSDGLVAIENAYVKRAPRAYVHRSHSGRYGLVNSEETYQNLKRFLLGSLRVQVELDGLDRGRLSGRVWQADLHLAIREVAVLMHDQSAEHHCPVDLNQEARNLAEDAPFAPVPLIALFLAPHPEKDTCRYALNLAVSSLKEKGGWFGFRDHLERTADWQDALIVDITIDRSGDHAGAIRGAHCQWSSALAGRIEEAETSDLPLQLISDRDSDGSWRGSVSLPGDAKRILGDDSRLSFTASAWD